MDKYIKTAFWIWLGSVPFYFYAHLPWWCIPLSFIILLAMAGGWKKILGSSDVPEKIPEKKRTPLYIYLAISTTVLLLSALALYFYT